jgi:16S rRNA (cytosine1402-N4)-methyltransferase
MLPSALQPIATDHVPVLADEVRELLAIRPGETVVDATFGAGGHSALLAADLQTSGKLIAIDRDPSAREYFDRFAKRTAAQTRFLRGDFSVVLQQLADNGVEADAVLMDLGVSSMQIDRPERGFSYAVDAPLDMRMDPSADVTAAGIVNEAAERDLATIFKRYGEERYAKQIARAIVRRRKQEPFERTSDLVETIKAAIPAPARFGDGHPAKRVFQALRIAVNDELGSLEAALPPAFAMLRTGGRLGVISFHSLEDRIVKRFMREQSQPAPVPRGLAVREADRAPPKMRLIGKPRRPSAAEFADNPRARSAVLRVAERLALEPAAG